MEKVDKLTGYTLFRQIHRHSVNKVSQQAAIEKPNSPKIELS